MVFAFWEGKMPDYIKLCMKTWKFDYILLDYNSLKNYIELPESVKRFTLPQIADYIRVHLLRDYGGYWLDTDTIVLGLLPSQNIMGYPELRNQSIGYLKADKPKTEFFTKWAEYQDRVVADYNSSPKVWNILGNAFTDEYVKEHTEISIADIEKCWPETHMIGDSISRFQKYRKLYFETNYHLYDIDPTSMLMLHNSWTPEWYKYLSEEDVLSQKCTLSNILKEAI